MSFESMPLTTETIGNSEHCMFMTAHESMSAEASKSIKISGLELLTASSCNDQVEQEAKEVEQEAKVESHDSFKSYDSFAMESYSKDLQFSQLLLPLCLILNLCATNLNLDPGTVSHSLVLAKSIICSRTSSAMCLPGSILKMKPRVTMSHLSSAQWWRFK
jgi:hypothetical protein